MITALQETVQSVTTQLAEITNEQSRIRQNMQALDRTNQLYQRYLEKLTDQETELEQLREEANNARAALAQQTTDWQQFLAELSVP